MAVLTPSEAAKIAKGVYEMRGQSLQEARDRGATLGTEDIGFDVLERFTGTTGIVVGKESGMGYIAKGGSGRFQNDLLIATRGTKVTPDWLTDINIGMEPGPTNTLVHAGFNTSFKSFKAEIDAALKTNPNPGAIHCVGHSLGGALATLNAAYLNSLGKNVVLYSFGCPRTGSFIFANALERAIGADNIYRVMHPADPVPMIPIFPFMHVPTNVAPYVVENGDGYVFNAKMHFMKNYEAKVAGKAWGHLKAPVSPNWEHQCKAWMDEKGFSQSNFFVKGSVKLLWYIQKAIIWLLKQALKLVGGVIGLGLTTVGTVIDLLVWTLKQGIDFGKITVNFAGKLISAIFRFLGKVVTTVASYTTAFLRYVFEILFDGLALMGQNAVMMYGM